MSVEDDLDQLNMTNDVERWDVLDRRIAEQATYSSDEVEKAMMILRNLTPDSGAVWSAFHILAKCDISGHLLEQGAILALASDNEETFDRLLDHVDSLPKQPSVDLSRAFEFYIGRVDTRATNFLRYFTVRRLVNRIRAKPNTE